MSRRSADEGHGITPKEQLVIDRLEAGETPAATAKALGYGVSYIHALAKRYIIGDEALNGFDRMVRRGDALYRTALLASGRTYR